MWLGAEQSTFKALIRQNGSFEKSGSGSEVLVLKSFSQGFGVKVPRKIENVSGSGLGLEVKKKFPQKFIV